MVNSYPLYWPAGWPRTDPHKRFNSSAFKSSFMRAREQLLTELRLLGARNFIVSSNIAVRQDGLPYADAAKRRIDDPGCAVYFTIRGKQIAMARDAYWTVHDNLRSITLSLAGLRMMERHGGAHMMERAFEGFLALPEHRSWKIVLELDDIAVPTEADVRAAYKKLALKWHPDRGGDHIKMTEINNAMAEALRQVQVKADGQGRYF